MGLLGEFGPALRALELTDAQREQIRGIAKTHEAEFREIGDRLRTAHERRERARHRRHRGRGGDSRQER